MSRPQGSVVNGHVHSLSPTHRPINKVFTSTTAGNGHPLAERHQRPHYGLHHRGGTPLQHPQISIEEADGPIVSPPKSPPYDRLASPSEETKPVYTDSHSAPVSPKNKPLKKSENVANGDQLVSPQHLMVKRAPIKSNSLPMGMAVSALEVGHTSSHSPSDSEYSEEDESSPRKTALVHGGVGHGHHRVTKKRSDTMDSLYSDSDSGSSSEDDKMSPILQTIHDDHLDDVFQDVEIDMGSEVDSKLIDWAYNVFVPACCTLLSRCAETDSLAEKESSHATPSSSESLPLSDYIKSDLRSLSNTINYFCSEQQRLSGLLKAKLSSSISTDRMTNIAINRASTLRAHQTSSNTSSFSDTSSGSFEGQNSQADRSYAVKILRSVSQSLIAPLLLEAENGFTHELYRSIIQALQKISWKVEACLSFNDPSKEFDIHAKIFDSERVPGIRAMMICAVPPEGPNLQVVATHASRSNSMSSPNHRKESSPSLPPTEHSEASKVIRRTPSGRLRPGGAVFDSGTIPDGIQAVVGGASLSEDANGEESDKDKRSSMLQRSFETTPTTPHRARTATTSEIELSPSHKSRFSTRFGSTGYEEGDDFDEDACPNYFRPKAARRTTISLSRREVTNLGLTTAKRVEESIIHESAVATPTVILTEDEMRKQMHDTLTAQFDRVADDSRSRTYFDRVRSASMSDLLEDDFDSQSPPRRHDSFQILTGNSGDNLRGSMDTLNSNDDIVSVNSARIEQTYVPVASSMDTSCDEWIYVPRAETSVRDPRMGRQSSVQSEPVTPRKQRDKKKKEKIKKNLSGSGKFADKLLKTAQALRRASVATRPKKMERERFPSVDLLSDDRVGRDRKSKTAKKHSRSEPPSPIPPKMSHSETMPVKSSSKHKSLKRFIAKKSKSFNSKDSLGRKMRGRSEFIQDYSESEMERECRLSFNESIENYSKIAVKPKTREGEEQLLISVEMPGRHSLSKKEKKRSSIISTGGDNWFEIVITTNMKQLCRNHYTILRTVKQVASLHDSLNQANSVMAQLLERPDKKSAIKKQRQQIEDLLRFVGGDPEMRGCKLFTDFLMPDDQEFGTSLTDGGSEVNFELLMTFYTPDVYDGPRDPGSYHQIAVVSGDDSSKTVSPSPPSSRKHSLTQKRGTMHLVKGKEENSTFVIREEGHDALIVSSEDDRYVVVAGTFEKLVEQLACEEKPDPRFVMTFLLGYRHFSSSTELLTILLRRFHMAVPPDATEEELAYAEKWRYVIQLRVLDILTYWMKKCWPDFYRSAVMLARVRDFVERLKSSQDTNFQMAGANLDKVIDDKLSISAQYGPSTPSESLSPSSSTPSTPVVPSRPLTPSLVSSASPALLRTDGSSPTHDKQRRTSRARSTSTIDLSIFTAIQVARQLTLIELDMLKAIETHELVVYMWESNTPENKPYRRNVDAFIERFNELSYWVASEICTIKDPSTRGALIEKFIEIAKHCHEQKNFNTTISIVSGLSLGAIKRLKRSWDQVGERSLKAFHKLQLIMKPTNNHSAYRKVLSGVRKENCIPYFGVYIRDLTLFNIGNEKTLKNGLLNFSKIRTMVIKFEELKRYQRSKYFFPVEDKIRDFCQNLWCMSEQSLYEASETLEPRDPPPPAPPEETDV